MEQFRVCKWDNLKVFMIMGIVLEHSLIIYNYPRNLELVWAGFISYLMPLFTLISGYWYKPKAVQSRIKSYLKPMLLFSGINFAVGYIYYPFYHSGFHLVGYAMWYFGALFCLFNGKSCFTQICQIAYPFSFEYIFCISFLFVSYCWQMGKSPQGIANKQIGWFLSFLYIGDMSKKT